MFQKNELFKSGILYIFLGLLYVVIWFLFPKQTLSAGYIALIQPYSYIFIIIGATLGIWFGTIYSRSLRQLEEHTEQVNRAWMTTSIIRIIILWFVIAYTPSNASRTVAFSETILLKGIPPFQVATVVFTLFTLGIRLSLDSRTKE